MSYGMAGYMGISPETTWGTAVSPGSFMELMSENVTAVIDRFDTRNIFNNIAEPDDTTGLVRIEGETVIPCNAEALGLILNAGLGAYATTSLTATYKQHVFQSRPSDFSSLCVLPPHTLEIFRDVTSAQQYDGCNVTQLSLAVQPNQDLRATIQWLGKSTRNKSRVAAASVLFPTTPGQPFTFDTASLSIAGAAVDIVEGVSIEINNNLEGVAALNASTAIARIQRTNPVQVNITGQIAFTDIVQYQAFMNQTEQSFALNFTKPGSFSCLIQCPRTVFTAFPLGMAGRNRQVVSFEAKARVPVGSVSAIAVTLKNQTLTY